MNKDELRKIHLAKRLALTESEHRELSTKISELFFLSFDLSEVKVIHLFLPILSKREPDTWLIIKRLQKEFPHIRLVLPKVNGAEMENIVFEDYDQLESSKWGMVEPKQGVQISVQEIDMVLVPLLAFDKYGHRVGFGKGYYDKFLASCKPTCKKIGISFFEEVIIDDINPFDKALDHCITPRDVILFKRK
jgi:5-formyltetrahydrofolate cyclo-ligase